MGKPTELDISGRQEHVRASPALAGCKRGARIYMIDGTRRTGMISSVVLGSRRRPAGQSNALPVVHHRPRVDRSWHAGTAQIRGRCTAHKSLTVVAWGCTETSLTAPSPPFLRTPLVPPIMNSGVALAPLYSILFRRSPCPLTNRGCPGFRCSAVLGDT
jgi:hypothetical protein